MEPAKYIERVAATQFLTSLFKFIATNKNAKTDKQIAAETAVDINFVQAFLECVAATDYLLPEYSPSGRFKSVKFNIWSKGICYLGARQIIVMGKETYRVHPREMIYDYEGKRLASELPDVARRNEVFLIEYTFTQENFIDIFTKEMGLIFPNVPEENGSIIDDFRDYPLVKAELNKVESQIETLKKELEDEIRVNVENEEWFKRETKLAETGKRTKTHFELVQNGTKKVVTPYTSKYWFDDEPSTSYDVTYVPDYRREARQIPDFPTKREPIFKCQRSHPNKISGLECYAKELREKRMMHEQRLVQDAELKTQLELLEKQKMQLDTKITNLKLKLKGN
jgi:hypothetical protein